MIKLNNKKKNDIIYRVYIPDDANQPSWFLGSIDPLGLDTAAIEFGSGDSPIYSEMKGSVIDLNYSRRVQSLTITFQDGSVGLCRTGDWGIGNLEVNFLFLEKFYYLNKYIYIVSNICLVFFFLKREIYINRIYNLNNGYVKGVRVKDLKQRVHV